MINGLTPYPEYKDSEQSWIGKIPSHWKVLPNRALFEEIKDRGHKKEEMLSVTIKQGVIRQTQLLSGSSKKDSSNLNKEAYKLVCPGDIAYNKMRAWQGAFGVSKYRGIVSPAYIIMRLREEHNPRYFHYLFRTPIFSKEAERWSYGITSDMWSLRPEHFKMIYTPVPPKDEQTAIVKFLDYITHSLNRSILAKKKIIALLNEQKRVIINQSVTRGLDHNVPLKPSAIPWIGDIRKHRNLKRLKYISPQITVGIVIQPARLYVQRGVPCLRSLNISSGKIDTKNLVFISLESHRANSKSQLFKGDVVIVRTGRAGVSVVVDEAHDDSNCIDLLIVRRTPILKSEYLVTYLQSSAAISDVEFNSVGAIQAHYNKATLANLMVPHPEPEEQQAILNGISETCNPIETDGIEADVRAIEDIDKGTQDQEFVEEAYD
jgi:type I restriction enzyme S subunit